MNITQLAILAIMGFAIGFIFAQYRKNNKVDKED